MLHFLYNDSEDKATIAELKGERDALRTHIKTQDEALKSLKESFAKLAAAPRAPAQPEQKAAPVPIAVARLMRLFPEVDWEAEGYRVPEELRERR